MEKEINEETKEQVIKSVQELVTKMGMECEIEVFEINKEEQKDLVCNIKTKDSNYLIGQYGINLQALQHIARLIVRKKTENQTNFILDVNSYRQEKNESVISLAKAAAQKAIMEGRALTLRPMSAYERRLVHMELSRNEEIKTESVGDGEDRHIIIKPVGII